MVCRHVAKGHGRSERDAIDGRPVDRVLAIEVDELSVIGPDAAVGLPFGKVAVLARSGIATR